MSQTVTVGTGNIKSTFDKDQLWDKATYPASETRMGSMVELSRSEANQSVRLGLFPSSFDPPGTADGGRLDVSDRNFPDDANWAVVDRRIVGEAPVEDHTSVGDPSSQGNVSGLG